MARYSESASVFAFGPHQTNYQTEVAADDDPKNYRLIVKEGYAKAAFDSPNVNNAGESTGSPYPNKHYKDRDTASFSATEQLTYQLLGLRAYDAFGVYATPVVVSAGAVWLHKYTLLNPHVSAILPSRPLATKIGEPASSANVIQDARMPSMTYSVFTLTNNTDKPLLALNSEWLGSGKYVEPSGIQFYGTGRHVVGTSSADLTEEPINKRSGVGTLYTAAALGGSAITLVCLVREITATINENLNAEAGYEGCALFQDDDPARGAIAGSMDTTGQTVSLDILVVADSSIVQDLDLIEKIKDGDVISFKARWTGSEIGLTGEEHYAELRLMRGVIASHEWVAVDGGGQGLRLTLDPESDGSTMPLELDVQTNVATFATYIGA